MALPTVNFEATEKILPCLVFAVADQVCCFPVKQVVRIIEMVTITPLPSAPESIQGVINLQGKTVPVLDLRQRLGFTVQSYGLYTPIILVEIGQNDHLVGVIVDVVEDVLHLTQDDIPLPDDMPPDIPGNDLPRQATWLTGIATVEGRMMLMLDPGALLSDQEQRLVGRTMNQEIQFSL